MSYQRQYQGQYQSQYQGQQNIKEIQQNFQLSEILYNKNYNNTEDDLLLATSQSLKLANTTLIIQSNTILNFPFSSSTGILEVPYEFNKEDISSEEYVLKNNKGEILGVNTDLIILPIGIIPFRILVDKVNKTLCKSFNCIHPIVSNPRISNLCSICSYKNTQCKYKVMIYYITLNQAGNLKNALKIITLKGIHLDFYFKELRPLLKKIKTRPILNLRLIKKQFQYGQYFTFSLQSYSIPKFNSQSLEYLENIKTVIKNYEKDKENRLRENLSALISENYQQIPQNNIPNNIPNNTAPNTPNNNFNNTPDNNFNNPSNNNSFQGYLENNNEEIPF